MLALLSILLWISIGLGLRAMTEAKSLQLGVRKLNRFIIWVCLPVTILYALHRMQWELSYWIPISMAWIVFGCGVIFFSVLGRLRNWSPQTVGALVLTAALGNTSFLGFPLLRALYGERAISIAILNDQPGSFLVLSTLGIYSAFYFSSKNRGGENASAKTARTLMIKRFLTFPPIWAMILAFALRPITFPDFIDGLLSLGMKTMIPLALISVGAQLRLTRKQFEVDLAPLFFGLGYKLLLAPLLMTVFLVGVLHRNGEMIRITLLESAMGPMITGAILADEYDLDSPLCSLLVSVGIPLCLISVPIWAKCLEWAGI